MHFKNLAVYAFLLIAAPFIVTGCSDDDDDDDMRSETIVDIAKQTPSLSTLVDALEASGLDEALSGDGPFTVFAPSNDAFAALPADELNTIISTPSLLTSLLQYHVVAAELPSDQLNGSVQTLLSGQRVEVENNGGDVVLNGSSNVTTADVEASNGYVHIIDEVLIPDDFYSKTITQIVAGDPNFSILVAALSKPELSGLLAAASDPTSDLTVFAPTNDAFEATLDALGKESIDDIPVGLLNEIVTYHILGGAVLSTELANGDVPTLLEGESVTVDLTDGVKINQANVTEADIRAVNGVIHEVDGVLLPSYVSNSVGTVAEVVLFNKEFTTLAAALRRANLLDAVADTEDITVFAPDNAAFVAAGITNLEGIDDETLTSVLTYHVLGARVKSGDLPASGIAETLQGGNLYLGYMLNGGVLINGLTNVKLVMFDIEKSNGVIHVIDRTLVPPAPNVVEIAAALADAGEASEFTVLVSLLTNPAYSDILEILSGDGPFTVFAPTDAAFGAIDTSGLTEEQIRTVLLYHAATAKVFSSDLVAGQVLPMAAGQNLTVVSVSNNGVVLQDKSDDETNVIIANVHGSNGVIHAVDKVLIPEL